MMKQYRQLKEQNPDTLLFFQLGEFYETFFEDAELAARVLDIVLTQRDGMPMAGVPLKKADLYVHRLLKRGIKVALCDQVGDPKKAKGLVEREVVRVITPGTVLDEDVLERDSNNYLVAVFERYKRWALAACDLSTGEFFAASFTDEATLVAEVAKLMPAELLLPEGFSLPWPPELEGVARTTASPHTFDLAVLLEHFHVTSFEGFGLDELQAQTAAGLLAYLKRTQKSLAHVQHPRTRATTDTLQLDPFTVRNLELVRELRPRGTHATLLGTLNGALTGMGQRLLRRWLLNPLRDRAKVEARQAAVAALLGGGLACAELREALKGVHDVERLVGRLGSGHAAPRDLLGLKRSLKQLPELWLASKALVETQPTAALEHLTSELESLELRQLAEVLEAALCDDAPPTLKDGGVVRPDYDPQLKATVGQEREARARLLALEARERKQTGIHTLKVGYNTVFGYFFEVSRAQSKNVPPHFERKQTLSNAERYTTPELKVLEESILAAQERARELEGYLFVQIRDEVATHTRDLQRLARALATLDVFCALAQAAQRGHYVRPQLHDGCELEIRGGRHPVVETLVAGHAFVPNDLTLAEDEHLVVLTGPNMSGKSTYLRQVALITLMAQMGSFVPAERARLPLFERIFTRVGASDMLAGGYSTFMVEMLETANILNNATPHSLVLLDEMGRGTSTFDGVSIAWAVTEDLVKRVRAKTLFATHYHELTQLAEQLEGVINLHVEVQEHAGEVVFLHHVAPGAAQGSYGIHVAKLAGLPPAVVAEAQAVLERILATNPLEAIDEASPAKGPRFVQQLALFRQEDHPVVQALRHLDVVSLSPEQALEALAGFKDQATS